MYSKKISLASIVLLVLALSTACKKPVPEKVEFVPPVFIPTVEVELQLESSLSAENAALVRKIAKRCNAMGNEITFSAPWPTEDFQESQDAKRVTLSPFGMQLEFELQRHDAHLRLSENVVGMGRTYSLLKNEVDNFHFTQELTLENGKVVTLQCSQITHQKLTPLLGGEQGTIPREIECDALFIKPFQTGLLEFQVQFNVEDLSFKVGEESYVVKTAKALFLYTQEPPEEE